MQVPRTPDRAPCTIIGGVPGLDLGLALRAEKRRLGQPARGLASSRSPAAPAKVIGIWALAPHKGPTSVVVVLIGLTYKVLPEDPDRIGMP